MYCPGLLILIQSNTIKNQNPLPSFLSIQCFFTHPKSILQLNQKIIIAMIRIKKSYFTKIIAVVSLVILTAQVSNDQEVPTTFGLITVTHTRQGDNSQFMKYLDKYATMDCPIVTELNIVWNNEQSMEELGIFVNQAQWKRPVYFYRTPSNSMNWRYKIPKESKSQVFFSIDDDITVDCEELNKGFEVWRSNAIGNIAPIISYGPRYYEYTLRGGFQYGKGKTQHFFNMGLVGLAFISRHFMDLYYTDLFEVKQMRDYIVTKNNCDDIGLNWVVQYFYPELLTKAIDGNVLNISPRFAQATSQNHYPFRTKCIEKFTEIFGVNTLRYSPLNDVYPGKEKRLHPLSKQIVLAKKKYLEKYVLNQQETPLNNDELVKEFNKAIDAQSPPKLSPSTVASPTSVQAATPPPVDTAEKKAYEQAKKRIESLENQMKSLAKQLQQAKQASKQVKNEPKENTLLKQKSKQALELSEQLRFTLYWRSYLELAMGLLIVFLIWKLIELLKEKQRKGKVIKLQSSQVGDLE